MMPRYFFHTCIGKVRIADAKGEVLRDADQAHWEDGEIVLDFPFAEAMCEPPAAEPPTKH